MTGEKFVDVDGIRTRYFEKGSGPVIVLFHGGHFGSHDAADCADDWSLNFDDLSRWFHIFAVDKIGQGFTDNLGATKTTRCRPWYSMPTVFLRFWGCVMSTPWGIRA